jgi:hypothetical protein
MEIVNAHKYGSAGQWKAHGSDWVWNPWATLVIMAILVTLFTTVTWGISSHLDKSDITGPIYKGQR